jgi:hypothetical protein
MKKSYLLMLFIWASIFATCLTSCNKDEKYLDSLKGTTWEYRDGSVSFMLAFTGDKDGVWTARGANTMSGSFTYTYNKPTVVIVLQGEGTTTATINGNTMIFYFFDGSSIILTKK